MTRKMLVDATHAEETRVAVVDGGRLVEFDYESTVRKQLKGSIFLAKVTRVEPSLQAAFVNFGGNRHGFLPFTEIHTDYYRIPVADRDALLAEQKAALEAEAAAEEEAERRAEEAERARQAALNAEELEESAEGAEDDYVPEEVGGVVWSGAEVSGEKKPEEAVGVDPAPSVVPTLDSHDDEPAHANDDEAGRARSDFAPDAEPEDSENSSENDLGGSAAGESFGDETQTEDPAAQPEEPRGRGDRWRGRGRRSGGRIPHRAARSEIVGAEETEDDLRPRRFGMRRQYKIQEVIKRGQIMLIQVSKEERGNKGAAVTTYLSLPGRYCVLMPNSPRGGGVSRKIANPGDRQKMKEILSDLNIPEGMSVILRTAGVARTKPEIRRDLDYLLNLWGEIRDLTLKSSAPAPIYEEASLIKRAVRDLYAPEIDEIVVSGTQAYGMARDFMKILMPSHEDKIVEYKDDRVSLFGRYQIEQQIQAIGEPIVTLRSGGYLVINPTEALISVDVNSGRATKERHIEETALKTNLEAADEVARQLRLRDLGGLVVIDFIDMEDRRNNARVERRLKDALSSDRARIQVGRISSFGLMELSRQRLNPSLTETQFEKCPHCKGAGHIRTLDSAAINALRALEEAGVAGRAEEIALAVSSGVALYILNNKRFMLADIERRYGFKVLISVEESLAPAGFRVDPVRTAPRDRDDSDVDEGAPESRSAPEMAEPREDTNDGRGRFRRGGRGSGEGRSDRPRRSDALRGNRESSEAPASEAPPSPEGQEGRPETEPSERPDGARRRGRRGGRRRSGRGAGGEPSVRVDAASPENTTRQPDLAWQPAENASEDPDDNIGNRREDAPLDDSVPRRNAGRSSQSAPARSENARPRRESGGRGRSHRASPPRSEAAPAEPSGDSAPGIDGPVPERSASVTVRQPARRVERAPGEDTLENRPAAAHETVNQPPGERKRGWWNRFMEG